MRRLAYDPLGRLWQSWGGPQGVTQFLYDGDRLTAEYDGSNNLLRRYVHGPGDDEPLIWYEGAGFADRRDLQADHQGSIISMTDSNGTTRAINAYDEYGIPNSTNLGRFQYTGQAWIPELGMYYYKARMYSPTLGRFMQTDPIGYSDGMNWHAYAHNDPVNGSDPSGLDGVVVTGCGPGKHYDGGCVSDGASPPSQNTITPNPGDGGGGGGGGGAPALQNDVVVPAPVNCGLHPGDPRCGGVQPQMQQVAQVTCTANRARHDQAVAKIGLEYLAAGNIVTTNVTFTNPKTGASAVADLVISHPTFPLPDPYLIIEVKTGGGQLERGQPDVYSVITGSGGTIVPRGLKALGAGFIPGVGVDAGPLNFSLRREPGC